jgi:hypothetical protein
VKLLRDDRVRRGLFIALLSVIAVLVVRYSVSSPTDQLHYEKWDADFGSWPDIFYTGAGGDGEVFAVLASDPFGSGQTQFIFHIVYRYSRIGFSWAAWALSFGDETLVLPALVVIGLLAVGGVGFASGFLRERLGWRSWILVLNPALYIGSIGDTAEPLAILLLLFTMVGTGTFAAVALATTRPDYVVALFGRWKLVLIAGFTALIVGITAVAIFDAPLLDSPPGVFSPPFVAYFVEPSIAGFLVLGAGLATGVVGVMRRNFAWVGSGLLVLVLGTGVTRDPINAVRVAGLLPVLWAFGPDWKPGRLSSDIDAGLS